MIDCDLYVLGEYVRYEASAQLKYHWKKRIEDKYLRGKPQNKLGKNHEQTEEEFY